MKFYETAIAMAHSKDRPFCPCALRALRDAEHPSCGYYQFLWELCTRMAPLDVIEIGTFVGTSAAHMAMMNYTAFGENRITGHVTTIDVNPDAARCVREFQLAEDVDNITCLTGDSLNASVLRGVPKKVDLLYVDGNHTFAQAYAEYYTYRKFVREGGLMIFDDVGLPMAGNEMEVFWDAILEPKTRLDHLHDTGFGIVEKTTRDGILHPDGAMVAATPIIVAHRERA